MKGRRGRKEGRRGCFRSSQGRAEGVGGASRADPAAAVSSCSSLPTVESTEDRRREGEKRREGEERERERQVDALCSKQ